MTRERVAGRCHYDCVPPLVFLIMKRASDGMRVARWARRGFVHPRDFGGDVVAGVQLKAAGDQLAVR